MKATIDKFPQALPPVVAETKQMVVELPITVIRPRKRWKGLDLAELWQYRELMYFLTWRDILIRYKQTVLGAAWALIQPLMYVIVFTVLFGKIAKVPTGGVPYPLFSLAAILPWLCFSSAVSKAGNSVVGSQALITKVYFPRMVIPIASIGAALVDFAIGLLLLAAAIGYYAWFSSTPSEVVFGWSLLLIPMLTAVVTVAALGVGTLLAALNVAFRDFKHTIPFLLQIWMFATPTIYMSMYESPKSPAAVSSASGESAGLHGKRSDPKNAVSSAKHVKEGAVPDRIQNLLYINPMTGVIGAFRSAILGQPMPWWPLVYSAMVAMLVFIGSCYYFHRVETTFADII